MTAATAEPADAHLPAAAGDLRARRGHRPVGRRRQRATSTSSSGLAVTSPRPRPPGGRRRPRRAGPHAAARVEPVRHRARARGGRPPSTACSAAAGQVFFCNSGAEANECAIKLARKFGGRGRHVVVSAYGSLPRPHAGHAARHRPARQARAVPAAARGLPPRRLGRPRRARARPRPDGRRRAARAGAGRGRREPGHRRVLPGRAPAVRRAGHRCSWSTRCRPASAAPAGGSASSTSASSPTSSPWPRRSATACPSAPAGPGPRWPPPSSPATTPRPSAASRSPPPRPAPCSPVMEAEDVPGPGRERPARGSPTALAALARRRRRCAASACCSPPSWPTASTPRRSPPTRLDAGLVVNAVTADRPAPRPAAARHRRRDRRGRRPSSARCWPA